NPQKLAQLIRLPGQQYDDETGLYYNRYRYYNPEQGRYISQDPIGLRGGWNLYTYPLNPVSGTDPLGLVVDAIPWGAATPSAVPPLVPVTGMFMGMTALDAALAGFEADVAVPEPTDAAWPKWVGWGVVIAASAAFTYLTCSSDDNSSEDAENPNVGKDLTDEEKNELGGVGSGSPNGWGPEDEENARNNEASSDNFDSKFNQKDLTSSANKPINEQGLSAAARAWEKHAGRPGGVFDPLKGNVAQKNEAAGQFVNEVLSNTSTVRTNLSKGGVEYRLPDGRGIRYNSDGSFSGFLDPKR
ncbi:RHS repeat-associated core domain-containing protein, partial [Salmonella enterica subsp. salamae]|nr:RHS repeat-associated core domain-containing protein [Salmonella enterica subsp. salamae]